MARLYLCGSYARREAKARSDIDFRIDTGKIKGYFRLAELYCELENSLKTKIDLLTSDALDETFLAKFAKEEVLLYAERT